MSGGTRRSPGFLRCWSLVAGGTIGSAIFMMPAVMAPYGGVAGLRADLHTLPERDPAANLVCRRFRISVIPGGVGVVLAIHQQRVVIRRALPWANGGCGAVLQKFPLHRIRGEIVVSFHHDGVVRFGNHLMIPCGFHFCLLLVPCGLQGEQAGVVAVEFYQVFVAAALDDSSVFDDDDLAGHSYC